MWRAGRRHGPGTYYDADRGVLAGEWAAGVLAGRGSYDTPHHHFEGTFVAGLPAGENNEACHSRFCLHTHCLCFSIPIQFHFPERVLSVNQWESIAQP
jgi:MORN repeat